MTSRFDQTPPTSSAPTSYSRTKAGSSALPQTNDDATLLAQSFIRRDDARNQSGNSDVYSDEDAAEQMEYDKANDAKLAKLNAQGVKQQYELASGWRGHLTRYGRTKKHVVLAYDALNNSATANKVSGNGYDWIYSLADREKFDSLAEEPLKKVEEDGTDFGEIMTYALSQHLDNPKLVDKIKEAKDRVWAQVQRKRLQ